MMEIERCTTDDEIDAAVALLGQLWTHESAEFVREFVTADDYHCFGCFDTDLRAVAGCSIQHVLHHRKHAWVHDLVVDAAHRSEGYGSELLSFVTEWASAQHCEYVALGVTLDNDRAAAFYETNDMEKWGYVFERPC